MFENLKHWFIRKVFYPINKKWIENHYSPEPHNKGSHKLSELKSKNFCKFMSANCDSRLANRLLDMGFIPGEEIEVLRNSGKKSSGTIMVKIKGSKVALSNKIADNISVHKTGKK